MTWLGGGKGCVLLVIVAACQSTGLAKNGPSGEGGASVAPPGTGGDDTTAGTGGAAGGGGGTAGMGDETVDAGTIVSPTVALVSLHDYDVYCGLKAGQVKCWTSDLLDRVFDERAAAAVAAAPPDLAEIAIADPSSPFVMTACGVDKSGLGSCWVGGTRNLGDQLLAVTASRFGTCTLTVGGAVSCQGIDTTGMPASAHYQQIALSEDLLAAVDEDGNAFFGRGPFPAGVYTEVVANDAHQAGAVRADGAVVYFPFNSQTAPLVRLGAFVHLALDYSGDACAIDRTGEITCWPNQASAVPLGASDLPHGPFTAIVGANQSFCALRQSGTTACWGTYVIEVPPGW